MPTFAEFEITSETTTSALKITPGAWHVIEVIGQWDNDPTTTITPQRKGSDAGATWQSFTKDGEILQLKEGVLDAVRIKTNASEIRFVPAGTGGSPSLKITVRQDRRP